MYVTIHHIADDTTGAISLELLEKVCQTHHVLTFDDGLKCQELAFPLLKAYGKKAIFFVNNDNKVERHRMVREKLGFDFWVRFWRMVGYKPTQPTDFLSEYAFYTENDKSYRWFRDFENPRKHDEIMDIIQEQICDSQIAMLDPQKVVDEGHILGLHSETHPTRMDALRPHEQYNEWMANLAYVRKFQREVLYASYPMGRYTEVTKEILSQMGIMDAFTSSEFSQGYLETPRTDIWKLDL